jgi:hypothetical protein
MLLFWIFLDCNIRFPGLDVERVELLIVKDAALRELAKPFGNERLNTERAKNDSLSDLTTSGVKQRRALCGQKPA